ncbi:Maf family nucleotide pyrophosphatase [Francisellaceae bacterium]|nr:Maf family nucleotide pyrophosphatase [Francisellaceae bacterium]
MPINFILASSSPYRAELLRKIIPEFTCISPDIDETPLENEMPEAMVKRLAIKKAKAIQRNLKVPAVIISSDQCAIFQNKILGKPHTIENAITQLGAFSGNKVTFLTSLCLVDSAQNKTQVIVEPFYVHFRILTLDEIKNYVAKEMPLNCAGSFKSEGLGITLFEKLEGNDPNSLIGLPLIQLNTMLRTLNINPLTLRKCP